MITKLTIIKSYVKTTKPGIRIEQLKNIDKLVFYNKQI